MFEKLKDAYVKARYSKHYRISARRARVALRLCRGTRAGRQEVARSASRCLSAAQQPEPMVGDGQGYRGQLIS